MCNIIYSAAAAEAVTAYSKEDDEGDDDKPYYLVLKKFAEAVHINILSFIINGGWSAFALHYNDM